MKNKLAVEWRQNSLSFLVFEGPQNIKCESIVLSGLTDDGFAAKVREFLKGLSLSQTLLVIPRSEVLQKEMVFARTETPENLEARLEQILPYSPREMAYSMAVDSSDAPEPASKALLYAIPEQKIKEILAFLAKADIRPDEVVSEDQALFWLFQERAGAGPQLVIDRTGDRILCLALKENAILLSSAYPAEEELKNIFSEISFTLLESGIKPAGAWVSGVMESHEIAQALEISVQRLDPELVGEAVLSTVLAGAKRWGQCPVISLLPGQQKIEKLAQKQKKVLTGVLAAAGVFIFSSCLLGECNVLFLKHKKSVLEKESAKIAPAVLGVRQMSASLELAAEAGRSKERLLFLLKELAMRAPASVRLREFQIEGKSVVLRGESPSHAQLTETVQVFEKMPDVKEAKLEHARLRKRLNQEFFDFEVTARWQD